MENMISWSVLFCRLSFMAWLNLRGLFGLVGAISPAVCHSTCIIHFISGVLAKRHFVLCICKHGPQSLHNSAKANALFRHVEKFRIHPFIQILSKMFWFLLGSVPLSTKCHGKCYIGYIFCMMVLVEAVVVYASSVVWPREGFRLSPFALEVNIPERLLLVVHHSAPCGEWLICL